MQGRKDISPKRMYQVNLYDMVSPDNFYRKLSETIDFFLSAHVPQVGGMAQANKHVLMAALTYNLKKLLKFTRHKVQSAVIALTKPANNIGELLYTLKRHYISLTVQL